MALDRTIWLKTLLNGEPEIKEAIRLLQNEKDDYKVEEYMDRFTLRMQHTARLLQIRTEKE